MRTLAQRQGACVNSLTSISYDLELRLLVDHETCRAGAGEPESKVARFRDRDGANPPDADRQSRAVWLSWLVVVESLVIVHKEQRQCLLVEGNPLVDPGSALESTEVERALHRRTASTTA